MSINKGKTKELVRHCGEHGVLCKCKRSFLVGRDPKRSHWSSLKERKVK